MRPTQRVGGLYLTVADSLAPLPTNNKNNSHKENVHSMQLAYVNEVLVFPPHHAAKEIGV